MSITTVLFDLDGTLLPMDQEEFTKGYLNLLVQKFAPLGYEPKTLVKNVWSGMPAMVTNDGKATNEERFWNVFESAYGKRVLSDKPIFDKFYKNEFESAKEFCGFNPSAARAVKALRKAGLKTVLATNPIFPPSAVEARIRWAGLEPSDFEFYTTYENSSFCKPSAGYYQEIIDRLGVTAKECLMVGNDVGDDMPARDIGLNVFLLTDCLINKNNADINEYPNGNFDRLTEYIDEINR